MALSALSDLYVQAPVESIKIEHKVKLSVIFLSTRPEPSTYKSDSARKSYALIVL